MNSKARIGLKLLTLACIPLTGFLAALGAKKYKDEMDKLEDEEEEFTTKKKVITAVKSYAPAAVTGAVAVASVLMMDHISMKQLTAAGGMVVLGKKKLDQEIRRANAYREATLEEVGEEKESEIRSRAGELYIKTCNIDGTESEEVSHKFIVDWLGDDVCFTATMPEVISGLADINREIVDLHGTGFCRVAQFLDSVGYYNQAVHERALEYGWHIEALLRDNNVNWLAFDILEEPGEENAYRINVDCYPNLKVDEYVAELEAEGLL